MGSYKRRKEPGPRFVALYHWVMKTEAWRDLRPVERCAYIEIASRYGGPGSNNGTIPYSVGEMVEALSISKSTAHAAIKTLQEHGFIVMTKKGAFNIKHRHATEWLLTEFPDDRATTPVASRAPRKDFARWEKTKHGSATVPHRVRSPNRTGTPTERVTESNWPYGSATVPVEQDHGSATVPPLVYQGGKPLGGELAVAETAPNVEGARECRERQHTTNDAPAPASTFQRSSDEPLTVSDALAAVLERPSKKRAREERSDDNSFSLSPELAARLRKEVSGG